MAILYVFSFFLKRTADVMATCLSVVFCLGSFPACWRQANVISIPKVHRPLLFDQFPQHQYCLRCLSAWCQFVLDDLWNAVVSFEPPNKSVLGPLLLLLYTLELFSILENKLIGYADDSTLMAVVPSPGVRVAVAPFPFWKIS